MHDVTAKKSAVKPVGQHPNFMKHHKHFPTSAWLRRRAPHNVPLFAFEYGDTGAGTTSASRTIGVHSMRSRSRRVTA
jgi:hypothetical protein